MIIYDNYDEIIHLSRHDLRGINASSKAIFNYKTTSKGR